MSLSGRLTSPWAFQKLNDPYRLGLGFSVVTKADPWEILKRETDGGYKDPLLRLPKESRGGLDSPFSCGGSWGILPRLDNFHLVSRLTCSKRHHQCHVRDLLIQQEGCEFQAFASLIPQAGRQLVPLSILDLNEHERHIAPRQGYWDQYVGSLVAKRGEV